MYLTNVSYCSVSFVDRSFSYCSRNDLSCSRKCRAHIWAACAYVNIGISSDVDVDDDAKALSEQGFLNTKGWLLFGEEVNIDCCCCCCCCLDGDSGLVLIENVVGDDADGDDGGDNFISARFLFTPCSTGSNSNERLSDATANMIELMKEAWIYVYGRVT